MTGNDWREFSWFWLEIEMKVDGGSRFMTETQVHSYYYSFFFCCNKPHNFVSNYLVWLLFLWCGTSYFKVCIKAETLQLTYVTAILNGSGNRGAMTSQIKSSYRKKWPLIVNFWLHGYSYFPLSCYVSGLFSDVMVVYYLCGILYSWQGLPCVFVSWNWCVIDFSTEICSFWPSVDRAYWRNRCYSRGYGARFTVVVWSPSPGICFTLFDMIPSPLKVGGGM